MIVGLEADSLRHDMDWKPSRDLEQPAHESNGIGRHIKEAAVNLDSFWNHVRKIKPGAWDDKCTVSRGGAHKHPVLGRIQSAIAAATCRSARNPFLER